MRLLKPNIEKMKANHDIIGLIKAFKDEDSNVRTNAACAVGRIASQADIQILIYIFGSAERAVIGFDHSEENRILEKVAEALGILASREIPINDTAINMLTGVFSEHYVSKEAKIAAAIALGKIGPPAIESLIYRLKKSRYRMYGGVSNDLEIQFYVVEALTKIGEPAVIPLVQKMNESEPIIREFASKVLEKLGWQPDNTYEQVNFLLAAQKIEELSKLGELAVKPLIQKLENIADYSPEQVAIRENAAFALGEIGDNNAVEPLIKALNDSPKVIEKAIEALGKIQDRRAVEPLIEILGKCNFEFSKSFRRKALDALAKMGILEPGERTKIKEILTGAFIYASYDYTGDLKQAKLLKLVDDNDKPEIIDSLFQELSRLTTKESRDTAIGYCRMKLLSLVDCSFLSEKIINYALDALTYDVEIECSHSDEFDDRILVSTDKSDKAIQALCFQNNPVTSNLLHLVAKKKDVTLNSSQDYRGGKQTVNFSDQRNLALLELQRRGYPTYDPEAYYPKTHYQKQENTNAKVEEHELKDDEWRNDSIM